MSYSTCCLGSLAQFTIQAEEEVYFEVVSKASRQHHSVTVPHHKQNESIIKTSPLTFCVQYYSEWRRSGDVATVFMDSDSAWISYDKIAPWDVMVSEHFQRWETSCSDVAGCIDLQSPVVARPLMAIEDAHCPVLVVASRLRSLGWKPVMRTVVHTIESHVAMEMDGRTAQSKKSY